MELEHTGGLNPLAFRCPLLIPALSALPGRSRQSANELSWERIYHETRYLYERNLLLFNPHDDSTMFDSICLQFPGPDVPGVVLQSGAVTGRCRQRLVEGTTSASP